MSRYRRPSYRAQLDHLEIPAKANRVLNVVLIGFILIIIRIWHLSVVQYDEKLDESRKPRRRVVMEAARRGTIRDRFNQPLAINKIQYQATVIYSHMREVPAIIWKIDPVSGKKVKHYARKDYITRLSQMLGEELGLDPERIEDLIHSKASYYFHIPFVIKDELTEAEYYRLKMLEKDWTGIHVRALPKRYYPRGRVGAEIIGYMGAINREEYESIIHEMKALEEYIEKEGEDFEPPKGIENIAQARSRLKDLEERAYTINDYVGKMGVEGVYEQDLRGFQGKRSYYSDSRGNFLKELPGTREPLSGQRFLLTISADLQEFTESLLAQNEKVREVRMTTIVDDVKHTMTTTKHPWIKGGAIVAMDPHTGDVLALASYPRFDPNDFIASGQVEINKEKRSNIGRWFENEQYLADIWNQKRLLERETFNQKKNVFEEERLRLDWKSYLERILPQDHLIQSSFQQINTLQKAIEFQKNFEELLLLTAQNHPYAVLNILYQGEEHVPLKTTITAKDKKALEAIIKEHQEDIQAIKKKLDPIFNSLPLQYDKVLFVDLCRLAAPSKRFSPSLIEHVGSQSLSSYRDASAATVKVLEALRNMVKDLFHSTDFKSWRKENEKTYLKQKRIEEKEAHRYPRPYIDYLDEEEGRMFASFWEDNKWKLLLAFLTGHPSNNESNFDLQPYYEYLISWNRELEEGAHQAVSWRKGFIELKTSIRELDDLLALDYLQTMRGYDDLNGPLLGKYRHLRKHNGQLLEKSLASAFYPIYGFGYARSQAYRQAATQGSIFKLVVAYEALVQRYRKNPKKNFSIHDLNPLDIEDQTYRKGNNWYVGNRPDGTPIPQLYHGGRLPRSAHRHLGKVDLIRALETSSNSYFALLAGECIEKPQDLANCAEAFSYGSKTGIDLPYEIKGKIPKKLDQDRNELYAFAIGQGSFVVTPLQTSVMLSAIANGGKVLKPKIVELMAGRNPRRSEDFVSCGPCYPFQNALSAIGIDFPLFNPTQANMEKNLVRKVPTQIMRTVFMPEIIRKILLIGMKRVVIRTQEESLSSLTKLYHDHPKYIEDYLAIGTEIAGKTSTSESMETIDLDYNQGTNLYTHVWFGGISFTKDGKDNTFIYHDEFGRPELVVVVYLRYGGYGKEAAPLASQVVKKWRAIKEGNHKN